MVFHAGEMVDSSFASAYSYQCSRQGKLKHDGKLYCATHYPPNVEARTKKRCDKYDAEVRARNEEWRRKAAVNRVCEGATTEQLEALPKGAILQLIDKKRSEK